MPLRASHAVYATYRSIKTVTTAILERIIGFVSKSDVASSFRVHYVPKDVAIAILVSTLATLFSHFFELYTLVPRYPGGKLWLIGLDVSYMSGVASSCIFWGWLADHIGHRTTLTLSLVLGASYSLAVGEARLYITMLLARFICGVANGGLFLSKVIVINVLLVRRERKELGSALADEHFGNTLFRTESMDNLVSSANLDASLDDVNSKDTIVCGCGKRIHRNSNSIHPISLRVGVLLLQTTTELVVAVVIPILADVWNFLKFTVLIARPNAIIYSKTLLFASYSLSFLSLTTAILCCIYSSETATVVHSKSLWLNAIFPPWESTQTTLQSALCTAFIRASTNLTKMLNDSKLKIDIRHKYPAVSSWFYFNVFGFVWNKRISEDNEQVSINDYTCTLDCHSLIESPTKGSQSVDPNAANAVRYPNITELIAAKMSTFTAKSFSKQVSDATTLFSKKFTQRTNAFLSDRLMLRSAILYCAWEFYQCDGAMDLWDTDRFIAGPHFFFIHAWRMWIAIAASVSCILRIAYQIDAEIRFGPKACLSFGLAMVVLASILATVCESLPVKSFIGSAIFVFVNRIGVGIVSSTLLLNVYDTFYERNYIPYVLQQRKLREVREVVDLNSNISQSEVREELLSTNASHIQAKEIDTLLGSLEHSKDDTSAVGSNVPAAISSTVPAKTALKKRQRIMFANRTNLECFILLISCICKSIGFMFQQAAYATPFVHTIFTVLIMAVAVSFLDDRGWTAVVTWPPSFATGIDTPASNKPQQEQPPQNGEDTMTGSEKEEIGMSISETRRSVPTPVVEDEFFSSFHGSAISGEEDIHGHSSTREPQLSPSLDPVLVEDKLEVDLPPFTLDSFDSGSEPSTSEVAKRKIGTIDTDN